MNSFGDRFKITTFGESHGKGVGCIVDGVPAGIEINEEIIQKELDRRRPGRNSFSTQRKEADAVEILSGVFEGKTTGTSIALVIFNTNQKSKDYSNVKDLFRPGHADFTYFHKYGVRDYRGGGRSSARETAARVAAGAIAKELLKEIGIEVLSGVASIGDLKGDIQDFEFAKSSDIFSLDPNMEQQQKDLVETIKNEHDSIGGTVLVKVKNTPIGLGEPIYGKLDSSLADAMMGINAAKGVEIGEGADATSLRGSENNDQIRSSGFKTNHAGGILGGISNGEDIDVKIHFKPTPSIFKEQHTVNVNNEDEDYFLKGRHDPCVAIRGSVVCEAMAALVVADKLLLNMSSKLENIKKVYN